MLGNVSDSSKQAKFLSFLQLQSAFGGKECASLSIFGMYLLSYYTILQIGIWFVLKSPKHSQALKYAEHAYVVMQESGILREMSGGW